MAPTLGVSGQFAMIDEGGRDVVAAREVYSLIVIPRSRPRRVWAWVKSLFWAAFNAGAGAPALDLEQAMLVRRATGEKMLDMDDRGSWAVGFIGELSGDLASLDVDAFERKWLGRQPHRPTAD